MNYLGHAFLSFGDADILCGNMMGDMIKGTAALQDYPEGVRVGLMRHRQIDTFTDEHWAIADAKDIFREPYGLYSGAVVDTLMDYFLANDERFFATDNALWDYAHETYGLLAAKRSYFPEKFLPYYESMVRHNWFYHYRSEEGIYRSLNGLKNRAKHIVEIDTAFAKLMANKEMLRQCYSAFIDDIISFVKIKLEP